MKRGTVTVIGLTAFALLAGGCAPGLGGGSYSRDEARREQSVRILSDGATTRVTH
jgi:outer membrane lipoprotein SlyB